MIIIKEGFSVKETNSRTLHPLFEILIISVIIFVINLIRGLGLNLFLLRKDPQDIQAFYSVYTYIALMLHLAAYAIATLICTKVIEKRAMDILGLCLIGSGVGMVLYFVGTICTRFVAQSGGKALATYSYVSSFVLPIISAILITLFVNIFDHSQNSPKTSKPGIYCNLFVHILLLLFTFGIWHLVWIYRVTQYLNCDQDEEYRNPTIQLLLCMFIPFYSIYWTYKSAQRIEKLQNSLGVIWNFAVLCLILEILIPIIPPILMQDKINQSLTIQ